ncbi:MAG: ATP-binding protein, partial [Chitinophagaceae bacterium]
LLGMNFAQLIDSEWINKVIDNYIHQYQEKLVETTIELQIITKDGKKKWIEQSAVMLLDNQGNKLTGFQCMAKDISEKKAIQLALDKSTAELKENQYRLQSILDNTNSLIFIKDLKGKYITVNKRFKELLQVTDEMVIGKTDFDINTQEQASIYSQTDIDVINHKKPLESVEILTKDNLELTIFKTKFPLLDSNNEVFGICGIATDITERSNNHKQLIIAKQEAEEAKKMQEQFLANMSHEIRTPINGIQGMTNLLLETTLNEQQIEFATIIKRSVNNLLVIINDILDFSKIKSGKLTIEKIDFHLEEIVQNAKAIFAHRLKKKGLYLNVIVDENVPPILSGDPYRLNQILINLIGNAIKFTEHGGVEVLVSLRKQTSNTLEVFFSVSDTGIGIPENKLADIFESFTQASNDTTRRYGGTGLGLAISKQLVELQQGNIFVISTEGKGSVFSFVIPYGHSQQTQKNQHSVHVSESNFKEILQNKKFLVVEDNEVNQKLITHVLQRIGGFVTLANNGKEAIDFLASYKFDMIIMDLQMPVLDGYEATKHIREVMQIKTPIIAMTATAIKGEQIKCIEIGMNDYMSKPFDFNDLYRRLVKLLTIQTTETVSNSSSNIEKPYNLRTLEEMNDAKIIIAVIDMFLKNIPEELKILAENITEMHWQQAYEIAHKLKSSATTLEAYPFAEILGKLEMNMQTGVAQENNSALLDEAFASFKSIQVLLEEEKIIIERKLEAGRFDVDTPSF